MHLYGWHTLNRLKEEGGLGFHNLSSFNLVLLAKQGYRIIINPTIHLTRLTTMEIFPRW